MKIYLTITLLLLNASLPIQATMRHSSQQQSASAEALTLTPTDITALIDETGARTTRMMHRIFNYSYTETLTDHEADTRGQVTGERSKVYEVYPVVIGGRGRIVRVQVRENGVPLDAEKIKRERERAVKEIIEAEQRAASQTAKRPTTVGAYKPKFWSYSITLEKHKLGGAYRDNYPVRPTDFLVWHEFYAARRTTFNGREAILLTFRPRPNFVYDRTNVFFPEGIESFGRVMAQLGGRVWIDATDKVIMRLEAVPTQEMNDANASMSDAPNQNAPLGYELMRLPNGTWFPSRSWYNSYGRENLFWKTGMSRVLKYSDYKLFTTSVESEKLDPPQAQP